MKMKYKILSDFTIQHIAETM